MGKARTAKLFTTGRSQAVRLPVEFRFEGNEVFIRRDPKTGDVILSRKPDTWDGLFELYGKGDVPADFMAPTDRRQPRRDRDPFKGWKVTNDQAFSHVPDPLRMANWDRT